jgi:hypothetical protein
MLSFLEAPKKLMKKANIDMKNMVWQEIDGRKRHHLVNWHIVASPKIVGSRVLDLTNMNKSL